MTGPHRLRDKVALVTGAASGIGAACAVRLAGEGATVVGVDIQEPPAATPLAATHHCDVRDEGAVEHAVRATVEESGRLDIVVHAAGVAGVGSVDALDEAEWDRVVDVNLKGTYLVNKHAVAAMLPQRSGSIVNLASIEGLEAFELIPAYCASKGGVVLLTRQVAVDYGRFGIRANCICPGFIHTPMTAVLRTPGLEAHADAIREASLLARFGEPDEVAAAAAFLASDDASYVTGHALVVDGGFTAGHHVGLRERLSGGAGP